MKKMGKKITYLKLSATSMKYPAGPAVEAGGEGMSVNLLT
jgi:hypothetical protein